MATTKNVNLSNELGVMALAFACIGQDAGIPGKPYMRIFPTSVDQCFGAIRGATLTCQHPYLQALRDGDENVADFISYAPDRLPSKEEKEKEDNQTSEADEGVLDYVQSVSRGRKVDMNGELGRIKNWKCIRNFLSTLLPIEVVDKVFNSYTSDRQAIRKAEIEARLFASRIDAAPKVVNGEQSSLF